MGVPSSLFDLMNIAAWCPRCTMEESDVPGLADLDLYLRILQQAYVASPVQQRPYASRRLLGSAYLGAVVPDTADVHNLLGLAHMRGGRVAEATREFEAALAREPASANARANLGQIRYDQGVTLLEARRFAEAAAVLRGAVDLMPDSFEAQNDLGVALASIGRVADALPHFERAVSLKPDFAEALRNLAAARQATALARDAGDPRTSPAPD